MDLSNGVTFVKNGEIVPEISWFCCRPLSTCDVYPLAGIEKLSLLQNKGFTCFNCFYSFSKLFHCSSAYEYIVMQNILFLGHVSNSPTDGAFHSYLMSVNMISRHQAGVDNQVTGSMGHVLKNDKHCVYESVRNHADQHVTMHRFVVSFFPGK